MSSEWTSAWATPVQFLNDRMELSLGLQVLIEAANRPPRAGRRVRDIIEYLIEGSGGIESDAFQMSFSGNPDELGQWRGYAADGMGCSIVTETSALARISDVAGWVVYRRSKQNAFAFKVLDQLRSESDNQVISQVLIAAASYIKHEGFRHEMEYRVIKFPNIVDIRFRETGDRLVPYVDLLQASSLPINRIIIGPGWQLSRLTPTEFSQNHVVQGIDRLLKANSIYSVTIESSAIPVRS